MSERATPTRKTASKTDTEATPAHPGGDPGTTDPGVLEEGHPYTTALDLGWYGDPSTPKESDIDPTYAGAVARARKDE
jgi:hypothetical protein